MRSLARSLEELSELKFDNLPVAESWLIFIAQLYYLRTSYFKELSGRQIILFVLSKLYDLGKANSNKYVGLRHFRS